MTSSDDVLHSSGDGVGVEGAHADALLHLYIEPQGAQLVDQIVANLVAARTADRGRLLAGDPIQVSPRALGAELSLWCGRRCRRWRSFRRLRPRDQESQEGERADSEQDSMTAAKVYQITCGAEVLRASE
jgi:hypothetical protein